jgi:hypothetical protein
LNKLDYDLEAEFKKRRLRIIDFMNYSKEFYSYSREKVNSDFKKEWAEIKLEDKQVTMGRVYEYYVYLYFNNGREQRSQALLQAKHSPINVNASISNVLEPKVLNSEERPDVQFQIVVSATPKTLDLVKKAIKNQDTQIDFENTLLNHREQYGDLLFTRVLRTDLLTGEIEDFGIITNNLFSDVEQGKTNNVSELQEGRFYKYNIITYARSAETMFSKFERMISGSNGVAAYSFFPYKHLNPLTLGINGSIITDGSFLKNHSENKFTIGNIVDNKSITIDLTKSLPEIIEARAVANGKNVLLRWKITGDSKYIDHFIISIEILGSRSIVGKSHAFSDSNSFSFIDKLDNNEHGELKYIITPIYRDFTSGVEFLSNYIVIE